MLIRPAEPKDHDAIWEMFFEVNQTKAFFSFAPDTPRADLYKWWLAPYMQTFVYEEKGEVLGTYYLKPNQPDLGAHVANGGYMVHKNGQKKGIGKTMCLHSIEKAKELGYAAMQFNMVISTNKTAVRLWQDCGFYIVGTLPKAFRHGELGLVDAFVMYRLL